MGRVRHVIIDEQTRHRQLNIQAEYICGTTST